MGKKMRLSLTLLVAVFSVGLSCGAMREALAKKQKGQFVYLLNDKGAPAEVRGLAVTPSGALSEVPGSPTALSEAGNGCAGTCYSLAYDSGRKLLFAASNAHLTVFSVGKDGSLTQVGVPTPSPARPIGLATLKRGKRLFLYVTETSQDRVRGWEVQADGSLTEVPGTPTPVGDRADTLLARGKHVLVISQAEGIHVFEAGADGALAEEAGSPLGAAAEIGYYMTFDPKGKHVYVPDDSDPGVFGFAFDGKTGALSALPGSPYPSAVTALYAFVVGKKQAFGLYRTAGPGLQVHSRAKNGTLTPLGGAQSPGELVDGILLSPNGKHLVAFSGTGDFVRSFSVGADGALDEIDENPVTLTSDGLPGAVFIER